MDQAKYAHPWKDAQADEYLGTSHRFDAEVSGWDLGGWNKVEGIGFTVEEKPNPEAGINTYTSKMLGRLTWTNVKLSRALIDNANGHEWRKTYDFIMDTMTTPPAAGATKRGSQYLVVKVMSAWGAEVRRLTFTGVRVVGWTMPALSTDKGGVAVETLTLSHEGLFPTGTLER